MRNFDTIFDFGDLLKDVVTGFEGIVMVKALYSTGCLHYGLSPQQSAKTDKGSPEDPNWLWYDESRLERVEPKKVKFENKFNDDNPSGPFQNPLQI